jgi:hypothetical protein
VVLRRVKSLGLGIMGIEPWKDGNYYGVETYGRYTSDPTDPKWYMNCFKKFKKRGDSIDYAASYFITKKLLEE